MTIHCVRDEDMSRHPARIVTFCGREGFVTDAADEYDTGDGRRFEANVNRSKSDCKSCLRAYKIEN